MERLHLIESICNAQVKLSLTPTKLYIHLNRPGKLNSVTADIVQAILAAITQHPTQELVWTGEGKAFSAGGDIVSVATDSDMVVPSTLIRTKALQGIFQRKADSCVIMKGLIIGGGVAVALCSSVRVATDTTDWSLQENSYGIFTDGAMTFYLNSLAPYGLGLYLGLTGHRINGAEAYEFGLATHYIKNEDGDKLVELTQNMGVKAAADLMHIQPPESMVKLAKHLPKIASIFGGVATAFEIFQRLAVDGSDWARSITRVLEEKCPLSLEVTVRNYNLAKFRSLNECFAADFDITIQMQLHDKATFVTAVQHRLVNKQKTMPNWIHSHCSQVSDGYLSRLIRNAEGPHL